MGKAFELTVYDVVETDDELTTIKYRKNGKTAQVRTDWLVIENGTAVAVSQTKQIRIDGLNWA